MGYARSRTVPLLWIWLGLVLTVLDSWNTEWNWVAPNILFSLALIRTARPYVRVLIQRYEWAAFALLVSVLCAALPMAANLVDYGAEGWLWALFGLCQRMYVDGRSAMEETAPGRSAQALGQTMRRMRWLACFVAAVIYVWQEQLEFSFSRFQLAVVIFGVAVLSLSLCLFQRGPSRIQPPGTIAGVLRFIGWHTLHIYVLQLAGSELIILLLPDLAA